MRRVRLAYNRIILRDRWHQILQQSAVVGLQSSANQHSKSFGVADDRRLMTDLHTLNHGVIHTYLICHASRRSIFAGSATMLSRKNIMMEYCSRLMRL